MVGFDFGTTNSLISVVIGDRVIDVTDDDDLPFPSVVRYEGAKVVVGRAAKETLDAAGVGIHGNAVRSPKFLLGEETVHVGGVERSPVDIVNDVVSFVKTEALGSVHGKHLGGVRNAVVTIPVTMDGPRRRALRDAFLRSEIGVVQFVHEPLAALYGHIRGGAGYENLRRSLTNRNVLVVDWGGGTLDLTLCRVEGSRIVQIRNGGSAEIGGDRFDEAIRDEVLSRYLGTVGQPTRLEVHPDAKLQLLHDAEVVKTQLSNHSYATFFRANFFRTRGADVGGQNTTLEYRLTREEMEEIVGPLVNAGVSEIEALLDSVNIGPSQISLCLVVGGMAAMPAIRGSLYEMFGSQRVEIPANSATLVSQGAAWIAHDSQPLVLAKPIELQLARGSYLTLLDAGSLMPSAGETRGQSLNLFCTDPTDGVAKVSLCTPRRLTAQPQASEPRSILGHLTVGVDAKAKPLTERIELEAVVDDDLILHTVALSSDLGQESRISFFDLEFGLNLPGTIEGEVGDPEPSEPKDHGPEPGLLTIRANIAVSRSSSLVPGEVRFKHDPTAFSRMNKSRDRATEEQVREHLYYTPCRVCGARSSDRSCRCESRRP